MIKTPGSPEDSFAMQLANYEPTTIALQKAIESALLEIISVGYERRFWKYD